MWCYEPGTGGLGYWRRTSRQCSANYYYESRRLLELPRKLFQKSPAAFPIQCIFLTNPAVDPRFQESPPQTVAERFPTNAGIVYIGQQKYNNLSMYGPTGVVRSQNLDNNTVDATLSLEPKEKPFGKIIAQKVKEKYLHRQNCSESS